MDVYGKLNRLMAERGWTRYRLAKECGLSESTLANVFSRNTLPSLATLETICHGFRISLSQFFAEDEVIECTPELKELFEAWRYLTPEQKEAVLAVMKAMKNE